MRTEAKDTSNVQDLKGSRVASPCTKSTGGAFAGRRNCSKPTGEKSSPTTLPAPCQVSANWPFPQPQSSSKVPVVFGMAARKASIAILRCIGTCRTLSKLLFRDSISACCPRHPFSSPPKKLGIRRVIGYRRWQRVHSRNPSATCPPGSGGSRRTEAPSWGHCRKSTRSEFMVDSGEGTHAKVPGCVSTPLSIIASA